MLAYAYGGSNPSLPIVGAEDSKVNRYLCKVETTGSIPVGSIMANYTPGSGYREGYADRMEGRPNKYRKYPDLDHSPVSEEYNLGYQEANETILRDARNSRIDESKKNFLQD